MTGPRQIQPLLTLRSFPPSQAAFAQSWEGRSCPGMAGGGREMGPTQEPSLFISGFPGGGRVLKGRAALQASVETAGAPSSLHGTWLEVGCPEARTGRKRVRTLPAKSMKAIQVAEVPLPTSGSLSESVGGSMRRRDPRALLGPNPTPPVAAAVRQSHGRPPSEARLSSKGEGAPSFAPRAPWPSVSVFSHSAKRRKMADKILPQRVSCAFWLASP